MGSILGSHIGVIALGGGVRIGVPYWGGGSIMGSHIEVPYWGVGSIIGSIMGSHIGVIPLGWGGPKLGSHSGVGESILGFHIGVIPLGLGVHIGV